MANHTYEGWAEIYAKRIAQCKDDSSRLLELSKIWIEIQKLTSDGKTLTDVQRTRMLEALKKALRKLGYDDSYVTLEHYKSAEGLEEFAKSNSVSNEEMLSMMSMVAKGPKR
ncbi:TPA: hypothetical protein QCH58_003277 [Enterobacter asburiae]|nr:hypothetical protein [Enterobacter asburiae]HDR2372457.1 hypothetical protein [Enterobacter asburiae]